MKVHKLQGTDAFIVYDLEDAPAQAGIVRVAPKILVDGATSLARSLTYLFATFEQQMGGASAGINAKPDDRAGAISAFVAEVTPLVADGSLQLGAGKGMTESDLDPLLAVRPGDRVPPAAAHDLLGPGAVAAASRSRGGLEGARVAIDGLDPATASLIAELASSAATIVAVATATGAVLDPAGIDAALLAGVLAEHGPAGVAHLDREVLAAGAVFGADVDVLFTGSKLGAIDHDVAAEVRASLVVPIASVPVTAKALAVLRRAGTVVLPDFVSAAGPWFATFPDAASSPDQLRGVVVDRISAVVDDIGGHGEGPLLGACVRAEAFLGTWQQSLPFGRPLA